MKTIERHESAVRAYSRDFPTVFVRARGSKLWNDEGAEFIDFFAGAGALNYGHNHPRMKRRLLEYIEGDGIAHGLDMATSAKQEFLSRLHEVILAPRGLDYRVLFPGPTGTNAVEAALKLARKVTGRAGVISFTNAFHGMTLGSLAATGDAFKRAGAGVPLTNTLPMPYAGFLGSDADTLSYLEQMLADGGSGVDLPAAIIVETVQGEGGLRSASPAWLRGLQSLCRRFGVMLVVDDIQAGCGRTGTFFSFDETGIYPDMVCLSKSISGYGLPMALVLLKPAHDQFEPGEHNGTFRGNNLAFVTATEALAFWEDDAFEREIQTKAAKLRTTLVGLCTRHAGLEGEVRGRGLMQGIAMGADGLASEISAAAFRRGLILETSGAESHVLKVMPPLNIDDVCLEKGLGILAAAVRDGLAARDAAGEMVA